MIDFSLHKASWAAALIFLKLSYCDYPEKIDSL